MSVLYEFLGCLKLYIFSNFQAEKVRRFNHVAADSAKAYELASNFFLELETKIKQNCSFSASRKTLRYVFLYTVYTV